jgi:hypothetical protein
VTRLPVTQQDRDLFAAYNARVAPGNQRAVVGAIQFTRQTYFNKARQFVNGIDYGFVWRFPSTKVGRFTLASEWSRYNSFFNYPTATAPRDNRLWELGAAKWRGNVNLSWSRQNWGGGVSAYYIGSFQDTGATTTTATYESLGAPSYISRVFDTGAIRYRYIVRDSLTYNGFVSYSFRGARDHWLTGTAVRFRVVNAEPPLSSNSRGYESTVYTTLARGRTWSLEVTKKL